MREWFERLAHEIDDAEGGARRGTASSEGGRRLPWWWSIANWRGRHWHFALYWQYRWQQANQRDDSGPPPEFGDPFSRVRVPAWRGPGGRSDAVALPEPADHVTLLVAHGAPDRSRD